MRGIDFFENVFDERFCSFLLNDARGQLERGTGYNRSNFEWNPAIRKSSAVVMVRQYDEVNKAFILEQLTAKGLIGHRDYHVMSFAWTRLSYIPWHNDSKKEQALTIYLNDRWDADWGGLFLYRDEKDEIRGFAPRFSCGLRNASHVEHATTPVTLDAPEPRYTVQLFSEPRDHAIQSARK